MRRKLQKAVSVLLLLALLLAVIPAAYADSTQSFTNSETYLRTSYDQDNYIELFISGNTLAVRGKLQLDGLTGLMARCGEESRKYINAASGQPFSVELELSHSSGSLPFSLYTRIGDSRSYWSFVWDRIYIEKTGGGYRIMPSQLLDRELAFTRAYVDPDKLRDSSAVPDSVRTLSNQIVGGVQDDYTKLFLLHKWVAENIYYDYDAYRSGGITTYDSEGILTSKRSVCEGYANLLQDLVLAQGIPCMKSTTYALGVSSNGGSFAVSADGPDRANHAHVEAWVNGHWVVMDPTWDSANKYENGSYNTAAPNGFYYFDITPEAFAMDHKYITRANGRMRMENGVIVGADTPPAPVEPSTSTFTDIQPGAYYEEPVAWAVENKIVEGTGGNRFSPGRTCNKAEIITFLWRAKGRPEPTISNPFTDISDTNSYYYKAALWAAEKSIISGPVFAGSTPCTRRSAVEYIWKAKGSPTPSGTVHFNDVPDNASAIAWAAESGVTSGTTTTAFGPDQTCTRAQIVTFLYRAYTD